MGRFGFGRGGTALSEKQHYDMLSGKLRDVSLEPGVRRGTDDGGAEGDVEDHGDRDRTLVGGARGRRREKKSHSNRLSWFNGEGGVPITGTGHGGTTTPPKSGPERSGTRSASPSPSPATPSSSSEHGHGHGITRPPQAHAHFHSSTLPNPSRGPYPNPRASDPVLSSQLNPHTHTHGNGHRYPPTANGASAGAGVGVGTTNGIGGTGTSSPKPSLDSASADATLALKQVGKAIKNAVLHDARNLSGRAEDLAGGLSWNVTSSHEAKVRLFLLYTIQPWS